MRSFHHQEIVPFGYDFLVAIEDSASVSIIDRQTGEYVRNQYDGVTSFYDSAVADFNRDGQPDILFATGQDIRIFDLINRFPIQSISCKSQKILIGQFDHDPSLEILYQTYPNLTLIDVDSGAEQQVLNFYAYEYFKADTDSDGIDEIICWLRDSASYSKSYIFAYDIDSMHLIWFYSHQKPDQIDLICTSSSLNENSCDVIFKYSTRERSTGSYRSQYTCLDGSTGSEIWTCSHENPYIMGMQLADTDRDGSKELIVLADEPSAIYIVDPATEEIEWKSDTFSNPVLAYDLADFDNDGIKDLAICQPVSKFNTSGCYTMLIYDAFSHALKDSIPLFTESKTTIGFATGDFHPDLSGEEYIVLTEDYGICTIRAFDSSHNYLWNQFMGAANNTYPKFVFQIEDIDNDGIDDIVCAFESQSNAVHLHIFDGITGDLAWVSGKLLDSINNLEMDIADIDLDGHKEIGLRAGNQFTTLDGVTRQVEWLFSEYYNTTFTFAEFFSGSPGMEIAISHYVEPSWVIEIYNCITHEHLSTYPVHDVNVYQRITGKDLNGDRIDELIIFSQGIHVLDNSGFDYLITPEYITLPKGMIIIDDYNFDGAMEILVDTENGSDLIEFRAGGPLPTPTPVPCSPCGVTLSMPDDYLQPGDPLNLKVSICNNIAEQLPAYRVFVMFSMHENYWFLPSWIQDYQGIDFYTFSIPRSRYEYTVIPEITWPGTGGTVTGARFLAAMTDPRGNVVGPIDTVEFGWE